MRKIESSRRLRNLGHIELAKRIEQGEFDEEMDEIDKQNMRNELRDSPLYRSAIIHYLFMRNELGDSPLVDLLGLKRKN